MMHVSCSRLAATCPASGASRQHSHDERLEDPFGKTASMVRRSGRTGRGRLVAVSKPNRRPDAYPSFSSVT